MNKDNSAIISSSIVRLISVSVGHFLNDFYMNLVPPILFVFAGALSLSLTQQGFLAFIITSSGSFAQPLIGHLCDKKGKPQLLVYSLLWITFFMSITGIITNYYLLVVVLGLGALASALYHPLGTAVTTKLIRKAQGTSLSFFMTVGSFAASVSPLIAIPLVNKFGLDSLLFLLVPGIIVALFMQVTRLDKMEFVSVEEKCVENLQEEIRVKGKKINMYATKWLSVLVSISTMRVLIERGFLVFGVQFLLLKGVDLIVAGVVLSAYLFAKTLGVFLGGIITDLIGTKNVMVISGVLSSLCIALMVLSTGYVTIVSFLVSGFLIAISSTANIVISYDIVPENITFATGLIMGLAGGIGGIGIMGYGKMADVFGLVNATGYLVVPLIITTVFTLILPETVSNKAFFKKKQKAKG